VATSIYSYGADSPLKFKISDRLAKDYNGAVEQFIKAQQRFNQKFGKDWDPVTQPIQIKWSGRQKKAWSKFAKIFNKRISEIGPIHANDIMDDFLIKNVGSAASAAFSSSKKWGRVVTLAATGGALYVLLSGRHIDRS